MANFKNNIPILLLFIFSFTNTTWGQADTTALRNDALKIFLDCEYNDYGECDVEFMKREISFVNYVRDRKDAQVHIMITRQNAGNGGKKYDILFIGQKEFKGISDTLSFIRTADNTNDEIRSKQLKFLKLGLIKYVSHTKLGELLEINFNKNNNNKKEIVKDKWNSWVLKINANTWYRGESSYTDFNLWSSISAKRITPEWKLEFSVGNSYSNNKFVINENNTIVNENKSNRGYVLIVKSLNEHWSVGGGD